MCEMIENDEFDEVVPESCKKLDPKVELSLCLKENKVIALIEGSIE